MMGWRKTYTIKDTCQKMLRIIYEWKNIKRNAKYREVVEIQITGLGITFQGDENIHLLLIKGQLDFWSG